MSSACPGSTAITLNGFFSLKSTSTPWVPYNFGSRVWCTATVFDFDFDCAFGFPFECGLMRCHDATTPSVVTTPFQCFLIFLGHVKKFLFASGHILRIVSLVLPCSIITGFMFLVDPFVFYSFMFSFHLDPSSVR